MKRKYYHLFNGAFLLCLLLPFGLSACSSDNIETEADYYNYKDEFYKYGSLSGDDGGLKLFGDNEKKKNYNGLGVNGYLWRASLDTISFMPIASADPFGGVIITDWYTSPNAPTERLKLNIFILDRDLRADGVKVTVFKQIRDFKNNVWKDIKTAKTTASSLEETILTRARQLKLAKKSK